MTTNPAGREATGGAGTDASGRRHDLFAMPVPERFVMTAEQYDRWHFTFCNGSAPCPLCDVVEVRP